MINGRLVSLLEPFAFQFLGAADTSFQIDIVKESLCDYFALIIQHTVTVSLSIDVPCLFSSRIVLLAIACLPRSEASREEYGEIVSFVRMLLAFSSCACWFVAFVSSF